MLKEPLHLHTCTRCKGEFPCWKETCALEREFICDDCAEDVAPNLREPSSWVC